MEGGSINSNIMAIEKLLLTDDKINTCNKYYEAFQNINRTKLATILLMGEN